MRGWVRQLLASAALVWCGLASAVAPITPPEHQRGGDQTFLTYPEWFLVHSPAEYATYVGSQTPTHFPYLAHVGQLWSSYGAMYREVRGQYPFNGEYHTMIMVIGLSTTVEYGLRGGYEALIGRLTELMAGGQLSEEDRYGAEIAQRYVDFIYTTPWYEFDYWGALQGLWTQTSFWGPNLLRKLERKYVLTSEYLVKAAYARLIKMGAAASFDAPEQVTMAVVTNLRIAASEYDAQLLPPQAAMDNTPAHWLLALPRYQPFTEHALALARAEVRFVEIAGNRGDVLITSIVNAGWQLPVDGARALFTQPILTQPGRSRVGFAVPVGQLHAALLQIDAAGVELEHVYDF